MPRFPDEGTVGGAETLLRRLSELAAEDDHDVTVLTTCATDHFTWANVRPPGVARVGSLEVRYFPVNEDRDVDSFLRIQRKISQGMPCTLAEENAWISNSVNSRALLEYLRGEGRRFDHVLTGPYLFGLTYFAAQVWPEKTILVPCLHDEPFAYLQIMRGLFTSVRRCAFNTPPEQQLACRLYDLNPSRCSVVGMPLEPFEADRHAFARERNLKRPYVLYSGRREQGKGTPLLCEYVHTFRERTGEDILLVFTGSGPIEAPPALTANILDLGFVSESEKHAAMAGAVAFVHPSVNESLGIVVLEAWLAGTPALVHAGSAVLKWQCQQSRGGLWFRHYPDFEAELLMLLRREDLREALGRAGRDYVRRAYSRETIRERLRRVLAAH